MNIFESNNRAVGRLRRGNPSEAVLILLKTVFRLRKLRSSRGMISSSGSFQVEEPQEMGQFVVDIWVPHLSSLLQHPERPEQDQNDNDISNRLHAQRAIPLYNHAFVFTPSTYAKHEPQYKDAHLWPLTYAVLLYNTALALHLKGLQGEANFANKPSFHLAIKFYKLAVGVLEQASTVPCLLLLLALHNNLAHVHCSLYNVEEALQCVAWLKTVLSSKKVVALSASLLSFFSFNVLTGRELSLAPAA